MLLVYVWLELNLLERAGSIGFRVLSATRYAPAHWGSALGIAETDRGTQSTTIDLCNLQPRVFTSITIDKGGWHQRGLHWPKAGGNRKVCNLMARLCRKTFGVQLTLRYLSADASTLFSRRFDALQPTLRCFDVSLLDLCCYGVDWLFWPFTSQPTITCIRSY